MMLHSEHFARILPIVGSTLASKRIALFGKADGSLLDPLIASGLQHWIVSPTAEIQALFTKSQQRHGVALQLDIKPINAITETPDLVLAVGGVAEQLEALEYAKRTHSVALLLTPAAVGMACVALICLPGEGIQPQGVAGSQSSWDWLSAAPFLAGLARALLLRGTPYERSDLEQLLQQGMRRVEIGGRHPFDLKWMSTSIEAAPLSPGYTTAPTARGTVAIIGCGSIGSEAAPLLKPWVKEFVLADPDLVDQYNPVRQYYRVDQIGLPKVSALASNLGHPRTILVPAALHEEATLALLKQLPISAAILATGSDADFGIAWALRSHAIPHIVARCYPRARYWEAIIDPADGSVGLEELRGHLRIGPAAAPTPEQRAAYSDAGALEAEPATLAESGWAAAWVARLTTQLLAPAGLRERWFLELLASQRTCIVGGAYSETTATGPAYGIAYPGEIHAWG